MSFYRLYFLDDKGRIAAREQFTASGDQAAGEICRVVADAYAASYQGYEIWSFDRLVSRIPDAATIRVGLPPWTEIAQGRQERILEIEDAISNSRARIARSKALVEGTNAPRAKPRPA